MKYIGPEPLKYNNNSIVLKLITINVFKFYSSN